MSTVEIGEYSAWICIEGVATPVYGVEKDVKSASCWISSQEGKVRRTTFYAFSVRVQPANSRSWNAQKFSVNWYNLTRRVSLQAILTIDGKRCDAHVMLDARRYPEKSNGVGISHARTSDWTQRDFQFSKIIVSGKQPACDLFHSLDH